MPPKRIRKPNTNFEAQASARKRKNASKQVADIASDNTRLPILTSTMDSSPELKYIGFTAKKKYRPEMVEAIDYCKIKLRDTSSKVYLRKIERWMKYCDDNRHRFDADPGHIYTAGSQDMVTTFFREVVFQETTSRIHHLHEDSRIQVILDYVDDRWITMISR